jgi:carbon-monoxide dehydrogenase small subunit
VETIEGVELEDLRAAFHRLNALQCGFCTPGMLLSARELLRDNPNPSRQQIRDYLSGNFCRCTGYQAIVDAVEAVAQSRKKSERLP